jgi:hypothetical protein
VLVAEAGRAWFEVPGLFACSIALRGARPADGWFFAHATFLHDVRGAQGGLHGKRFVYLFLRMANAAALYPQTFRGSRRGS